MSHAVIILCGGRSTRMGQDKALLPLAGRPLIAHVIDRLGPWAAELLLAVGPQARYTELGVPIVVDELPDVGPIAGLHAGLKAMSAERALLVAGDMPLVVPEAARRLVEWAEGFDAVVPHVGGRYQPTFAVYGRSCRSAIERAVNSGRTALHGFLADVRLRTVFEAELRKLDPDLMSLRNMNTPADLQEARRLLEGSPPGRV